MNSDVILEHKDSLVSTGFVFVRIISNLAVLQEQSIRDSRVSIVFIFKLLQQVEFQFMPVSKVSTAFNIYGADDNNFITHITILSPFTHGHFMHLGWIG